MHIAHVQDSGSTDNLNLNQVFGRRNEESILIKQVKYPLHGRLAFLLGVLQQVRISFEMGTFNSQENVVLLFPHTKRFSWLLPLHVQAMG